MDSGYYYVNELSYLPTKYIRKIEESLDCILKEVPDVREVYLFGSCARGDYKWNSDVDIAVITDETITDHALRGNVSCALDEYSEEGVRADVIFRTPTMHDISPTFLELFNKDKKLIWRKTDDRE